MIKTPGYVKTTSFSPHLSVTVYRLHGNYPQSKNTVGRGMWDNDHIALLSLGTKPDWMRGRTWNGRCCVSSGCFALKQTHRFGFSSRVWIWRNVESKKMSCLISAAGNVSANIWEKKTDACSHRLRDYIKEWSSISNGQQEAPLSVMSLLHFITSVNSFTNIMFSFLMCEEVILSLLVWVFWQ